ncbi:putative protein kinase [Erysiphe neolycopersici]|uniref:Pal1 cell morphology n=1 Tax=Erysiphe neolycopersici TaxID=212602 RepID=A0A420HKH5_9PEZI|nr:putative protein kinase [Erysiphe neolycopersici]
MLGSPLNSKGRASSVTLTPSTNRYPTPPASASPTQSSFHRQHPSSSKQQNSVNNLDRNIKARKRCSSLCERFPGDMSHRPLDVLRQETFAANRAPHLKKKHIPGADTIDSLDRSAFGLSYHHGGPYDATLLARNRTRRHAPIEALKSSNDEAIRATPKEFIKASIERHLPLQGTAVIPPGMAGIDGQIMQYEEGADLMREPDAPGGAYKRWPDMKYLPEDLKGKGEPSYSIEKAIKKDKHRKTVSGDRNNYEMYPLMSPKSPKSPKSPTYYSYGNNGRSRLGLEPTGVNNAWNSQLYPDYHGARQRGLSTGQRVGEGLKRRLENLAWIKKSAGTEC